jgi:hypothetical protein
MDRSDRFLASAVDLTAANVIGFLALVAAGLVVGNFIAWLHLKGRFSARAFSFSMACLTFLTVLAIPLVLGGSLSVYWVLLAVVGAVVSYVGWRTHRRLYGNDE